MVQCTLVGRAGKRGHVWLTLALVVVKKKIVDYPCLLISFFVTDVDSTSLTSLFVHENLIYHVRNPPLFSCLRCSCSLTNDFVRLVAWRRKHGTEYSRYDVALVA